ncbi:sushi, von Willebrand factor type A, EGF and pentraxin domain-containing protein 1-like [Limulus polyphemus]|uniref:Sushi, von Willebrand factor type A, EGF and pentraxin domain-containing protein 1-like n=1 Tax=Limulus polyphemus TaxID=6850 RepID=A0ABM1RUN5_LIMPO|nr:sushi, von Willebrand factor type A, EGF and pentraxin domain-containing protein 1-like [Limulus polyphemus]
MCILLGSWSGESPSCELQQSYCPTITAPENGEIAGSCSSAVTGDRCAFSCVGDYQLVGVSDLICLDTGSWSGESPSCELQQSYCPTITAPENGEIAGLCSSAVTGDRCAFSCVGDYQLVGVSDLTCLDNGSWSGESPSCELQQSYCPTITAPENGEIAGSCTSAVTGDRCAFFCVGDYQLVGISDLTCLDTGSWSGESPSCELQQSYCPTITVPENGEIEGSCFSSVTGDRCTFTCVGDYQLVGVSELICLDTGSWSGDKPTCELEQSYCPTLSAPENGEIAGNCSFAVPGDRCTFSCLGDRQLVGVSELICLDTGSWSGEVPTCGSLVKTTCPDLTATPNSLTNGSCSAAVAGDTCVFSCGTNFQLKGSKVVTCLEGGATSSVHSHTGVSDERFIFCGQMKFQYVNVSDERFIFCGQVKFQYVYVSDERFIFCGQMKFQYVYVSDERLIFYGQMKFQYVNVSDERLIFYGQMKFQYVNVNKGPGCPPLTLPNHGEYAGSCLSAVAGQRCSFSCVGDNQLLGPSTLICLESGDWSAAPPTCEQSICDSLRAPTNGIISGFCSSAVRGDRCTFSCEKSYKLVGDSELICLDSGKWSKESPSCERSRSNCEEIKPPANGRMYGYCSSAYPGDTCMFSCEADFQVRGLETLTCLEPGVWSGNVPICEKVSVQCPSLPDPANGKVLPCHSTVGSRCKITCSPGYTIFIGSSTRTCLSNGAWSGIETMCVTESSFLQWVPRAFG